jgi:hypothetical protein
MHLHVRYKEDLSAPAGTDAAARWTEIIHTTDPTSALKELAATTSAGGRTIAHVLIRGEDLP